MKEEWRDIEGYEGKYQVSNLGRVKSLNFNRTGKEEILSGTPNTYGYLQVGLSKNSIKKPYTIHKLVAEAFIDNPNNYKEVNHKDENKQNNRVENLEWCTREYNINYGTRNKKTSEKRKGFKYTEETKKKISESRLGSKHPQARKVLCVTTGRKFNCIKEAAEYYSINSYQNISVCCKGKLKSAGKHPVTGEKLVWKYI